MLRFFHEDWCDVTDKISLKVWIYSPLKWAVKLLFASKAAGTLYVWLSRALNWKYQKTAQKQPRLRLCIYKCAQTALQTSLLLNNSTQQKFAKQIIKNCTYFSLLCWKYIPSISKGSGFLFCYTYRQKEYKVFDEGRKVIFLRKNYQTTFVLGHYTLTFCWIKLCKWNISLLEKVTQIWRRLSSNHPVMDYSHRKSSYTLRNSQINSQKISILEVKGILKLKNENSKHENIKNKIGRRCPVSMNRQMIGLSFKINMKMDLGSQKLMLFFNTWED